MLTPEEIARYKRQLVLKEIGGEGQQKLKAARVLVVGAGGLGSPLILYLAAAGIGEIGIIDSDRVSLDNLQRQIVHDTKSVGRSKTKSAASAIERLNPHVADAALFDPARARERARNRARLRYRRRRLRQFCHALSRQRRLLFRQAAAGIRGGRAVRRPSHHLPRFESDGAGNPRPSYRCLFPEPPPEGTVAPCSEAGILGAVAGVIGTLAAVEVVKELLGIGESLVGRLLLYDALQARFSNVAYGWDPENPLNGKAPRFHDLSHHRKAMVEAGG